MADAVAIISILSGSAVAITVPVITASLERRRLQWESEKLRIDETRGVVDTALQNFSEALWQLHFAWRALAGQSALAVGSFRAPMPKDFSAVAGLQRADEMRAMAMAQEDRLAVRLGYDHAIVQTYQAGVFQLGQLTGRLARGVDELATNDEWNRAVRNDLNQAWKLRLAIVDEASRLVGVRGSIRSSRTA
jgi:hypothetical protein